MSVPTTSTGVPAFPTQRSRPATTPWTPPDHLALALSRLRSATPLDAVEFVAPCPACGADSAWFEEREDTRLCVRVDCGCPAA